MLKYRNLEASDIDQIAEIYFPYITDTAVSFEKEVPSIQVFENRLVDISSKFPFIVLEENHQILGYAYGSTHREREAYKWAVETSIYMAPVAVGKGYAKGLYDLLLNELIQRNFTHAFGIITLPNHPSVGLHKACNFKELCVHASAGNKFGQWHDVLWMRRQLAAETHNPPEPNFVPFTF